MKVRSDFDVAMLSSRSGRIRVNGDIALDAVDQVLGAGANLVASVDELVGEYAVHIRSERCWERHAISRQVARRYFCIQYLITSNDLGLNISQQRKLYVVGF